jgi:RNA polymerase sigma-70 factor (ECF subfamily)
MSTVIKRFTVATERIDKLASGTQLNLRSYVGQPVRCPDHTDYALARAAAQGGMMALAALYERHHRHVYSLCLRMTNNSAEAEDLAQEVFIHLVRNLGSFRGESKFTSWLYRLTVNLVLMHFRRLRGRREQLLDDFEKNVLAKPRQSAGAQITDRIALKSALAQLSNGCRKVFVLFDVEGYSHVEIAHLLGCSTGTSKSQLHKARLKLRRLLDGQSPN